MGIKDPSILVDRYIHTSYDKVKVVSEAIADVTLVSTNITTVNTVATNIPAIFEADTSVTANAAAALASENAAAASETTVTGHASQVALDLIQTNQDTIDTAADVVLTHADVVLAEADKVQTALDRVATNADVVLTAADAAQTALDRTAAAESAATFAGAETEAANNATAALNSAIAAATSYDDFDDRFLGAKADAPNLDNDDQAILTGAMYFNSTTNKMQVYDGTSFIGVSSAISGLTQTFSYVSTEGQTVYSGNDSNNTLMVFDSVNAMHVFLNGIKLVLASDYTVDTGTGTVALTAGAVAGDLVEVSAFSFFQLSDTFTQAQITQKDNAALPKAGGAMTGAITSNNTISDVSGNVRSGRKNVVINGNFSVWQRALSQTASGYGSDDRWINYTTGATQMVSRQTFALGQTDVPANPKYYARTVVGSVAGAGNYVIKAQNIEGVQTFQGTTATISFWAKADASKNIAVECVQYFGTGGSPSTQVSEIGVTTVALTTSWAKHTVSVAIPSIAGKELGTDGNDYLGVYLWMDAGSSFNARTNSLGHQSGTFEFSQVQMESGSVATDFEPRTVGEEYAMCQRYYEFGKFFSAGAPNVGTTYHAGTVTFAVDKRVFPTIVKNDTSASTVITNRRIHEFSLYTTSTSNAISSFYTADSEL